MKRINLFRIVLFIACLVILSFACSYAAGGNTANPGYEYYYNCLNPVEKEIYSFLKTIPRETDRYTFSPESDISGFTDQELQEMVGIAHAALNNDHPESSDWSWTQGQVLLASHNDDSMVISVEKSCFYRETDQQKTDHIIDQIVEGADSSWNLFTKAKYIQRTIIAALDYNLAVETEENQLNTYTGYCQQNCFSINTGIAVCEGYCKVFKVIADRIQLPCIMVGSISHAFLYVMNDDGNWYGVEPQESELRLYGSNEFLGRAFESDGSDIYVPYGIFEDVLPVISEDSYVQSEEDNSVAVNVIDLYSARNDISGEAFYDYKVNADGQTCTLLRYTGPEQGDLIVPDTIDGYPVTVIGNSAYAQCAGFTGSLIIPDTVVTIEQDAFRFCHGLSGGLTLSENLVSIGASAFQYCTFSGSIHFPSTLRSIGEYAFALCLNVEGNIALPEGLQALGNDGIVFSQMPKATGYLYIPASLESFSAFSIFECGFTEIRISPDNPTYIVYDGMLYTKDMKCLVYCPRSRQGELVIPDGVEIIGGNALAYCRKITGLVLPDSIRKIEQSGCRELTSLSSPIQLPQSLVEIGAAAFSNTPVEKCVHIRNNMVLSERAFYEITNTTTVYVEDGITTLPDLCFANNSVTEFHLPSGLESIGTGCFWNGFKSIIFYSTTGSYAETFAIQNGFTFIDDTQTSFHLNTDYLELCGNSDIWPSTAQLQAISNETGEIITDITWTTPEDNYYFSVSSDGTITAYSWFDNVFYTTVTATDQNGHSRSCTVCCIPDPAKVRMQPPVLADWYNARKLVLCPGYTGEVKLYLENGNALDKYFSQFKWSVSDTQIADVSLLNSEGFVVIRAFSPGTTYLTMEGIHGEYDIIPIIVADEPQYMYFADHEITLYYPDQDEGKTKIQPLFLPEGTSAGITEIHANNYNVVRTLSDGTIEAIGPGRAVVTVKVKNDLFADIVVNVIEFPYIWGDIDQRSISYSLDVTGEMHPSSVQLGAVNRWTDEEIRFISWESDDPGIARVDDAGIVSAVSVGSTTIRATAENRTVVQWTIHCKTRPNSIALVSGYDHMNPGDITDLSVHYCPLDECFTDTEEYVYTITSSDPSIIAIRDNQYAVAISEGIATICVSNNAGMSANKEITVGGVPSAITTDQDPFTVYEGQIKTVELVCEPENAVTNITRIEIDDKNIAEVLMSDNRFSICGESMGETTAAITTSCGIKINITVRVLDPWGKPEYIWNDDNTSVTAQRSNLLDVEMTENETVPVSWEVTKPATCTEPGETTYTSGAFENEAFEVQIKTLADVAALGHDWNPATYMWSADNLLVTAAHTCKNDALHTETETVNSIAVVTPPEEDTEGFASYTSELFANTFFFAQSKNIVIPPLNSMDVIRLPRMLTSIEDEAFENLGCEAIIIPDECLAVGHYAFRNCRKLKYIRVSAGTELPSDAFDGCEDVVADIR